MHILIGTLEWTGQYSNSLTNIEGSLSLVVKMQRCHNENRFKLKKDDINQFKSYFANILSLNSSRKLSIVQFVVPNTAILEFLTISINTIDQANNFKCNIHSASPFFTRQISQPWINIF